MKCLDCYLSSSGGTSLVFNSLLTEQFNNGLFSFPLIFLKSQLLSQFQEEHARSSSNLASLHRKCLFSVSSINSTHSLLEEIELFQFSYEEMTNYLKLYALSIQPSSSSLFFNTRQLTAQFNGLYSTFLVIWQLHIYLMTHSLFYETFQQNLTILSQHEQSDGDRTHIEGPPSSTTSSKIPVPFLRPSQQPQPNQQQQRLITFTPIYQSTQISLSNIHQNQQMNSNKDSDIFKLQEPMNSKIYLEQVILTSSSPLSVFLSWIIVFHSIEVRTVFPFCTALICFLFR
jgi:hypothetical protein